MARVWRQRLATLAAAVLVEFLATVLAASFDAAAGRRRPITNPNRDVEKILPLRWCAEALSGDGAAIERRPIERPPKARETARVFAHTRLPGAMVPDRRSQAQQVARLCANFATYYRINNYMRGIPQTS